MNYISMLDHKSDHLMHASFASVCTKSFVLVLSTFMVNKHRSIHKWCLTTL